MLRLRCADQGAPVTKEEVSLLLYLETCAVDHGGMVDARRMNAEDFDLVKKMQDDGLLRFGRMLSAAIGEVGRRFHFSHWVELLDPGWNQVAQLRRQRADRKMMNKLWRTESSTA